MSLQTAHPPSQTTLVLSESLFADKTPFNSLAAHASHATDVVYLLHTTNLREPEEACTLYRNALGPRTLNLQNSAKISEAENSDSDP